MSLQSWDPRFPDQTQYWPNTEHLLTALAEELARQIAYRGGTPAPPQLSLFGDLIAQVVAELNRTADPGSAQGQRQILLWVKSEYEIIRGCGGDIPDVARLQRLVDVLAETERRLLARS